MSRITPEFYITVRDWVLENDPDGNKMYQWANQETGRPQTPEKCAAEIIWIILCAGRSAQAARTIESKVWDAIKDGRPVVEVFGYKKKADAIERAWNERINDFKSLNQIGIGDAETLLEWCQSIPFIGDDTKFQLAKNFGEDLCKPDIWLCRLAGIPDKPRQPIIKRFRVCQTMCKAISLETFDRIATIDSMLWLACNKRILHVSAEAGSITFDPDLKTKPKPIFEHD